MQTGYIEVEGGQLYYEMAGEGETVVFVHAGFVDSRMWDAQWEVFAQQYQVIRFDMRGFGKSSPVTAPLARRDDLALLLQQLGISKAHLVGCSLGGEIILDFALEHPEQLLSLVLVSAVPSGFEMQGEPPQDLLLMIDALQKGDLEAASELQLRLWVDGGLRQPDQVDAAVRALAAEMNRIPVANGTWFLADMQPLNPLNPPAASRLAEIHAPLLAIVGGLDHPEILRAAEVLSKEVKGAQNMVIADCAHVPNMEKPAEFNQLVLDFLHS